MRGIPRSFRPRPSDKCREVLAMNVPRVATLSALVVFSLSNAAPAFQGPPIIFGGGQHPGKGAKGANDTGGGSGGGTAPGPRATPNAPAAPSSQPTPTSAIGTTMPVAPSAPPPWVPTPLNLSTESDDGWVLWWEYDKMEFLRPHRLGMWGFPATGSDDPDDLAARLSAARAGLEPALERALQDPDLRVRTAATTAMARVGGDAAVEPLLKLLEDPSMQVRERAILALGATGSRQAVRPLLALATYGTTVEGSKERMSPYANPLAIVALAIGRVSGFEAGLDSTVASIVRTHTGGDRDQVVAAALIYQCLVPGPDFGRLAIEASDDATLPPYVRCRAVESLAHSSDSSAMERLAKFLKDARLDFRRSAALALGTVRDPAALSALTSAYGTEADLLTRGYILVSIGRQGGDKAREFLLHTGKDGETVQRKWAALGLGILARYEGRHELGAAIRELAARERAHESVPAYWIAEGLARDDGSLESIVAGLGSSADPTQRMYAATSLALLGGDAAEKALRARIDVDDSALVRSSIAAALGYLGYQGDARVLVDTLQKLKDPDLQGLTATALSFHGSVQAFQILIELSNQTSGNAVRRSAAVEGLGMMLAPIEPFLLADVSRAANYTVFSEWVKGLFQTTL
jgi:HEAT repeat protein